MKGKETEKEIQAQVMAALLAGQGVNETARTYNLPKYTVSRIKKKLEEDPELQQVATKAREDLSDLIETYLRETLITLAVQAKHFRDKDWLNRQKADQLAVLHGVQTDKTIRILEAAEAARESDDFDASGD